MTYLKINNLKISFLFVFSFVLLTSNIFGQERKLADKIVAQLGSELILLSDIESEYNYYKSQNQPVDDNTRCNIIQQQIAQKMLIDQAKHDSLEVTEDQVNSQLGLRIESVLKKMGGDEELFKQYYGKTVAEMKETYREDIRNNLLAENMQQKLIENINITPAEVTDFFNKIPVDSLPFFNSEVELAQIIIAPQVNNLEKSKAQTQIEKIKSDLVNGASFEELAKKYSDDPGSASKGGDLGWVKRGTFVPAFEAVAFTLKKGEISDIVETEFGYHIIQLLERRGNSIHTKHILIKPQITGEDLKIAQNKLDSIRNLVINDSIKFDLAVVKFSEKSSPNYSNNGRMTNPANQTTFFEMNDLPPDVYFAIENLKPGELTKVLETTNESGETRYQVLKVLTLTTPHRANLHQDYSKLSVYAKNSKKNEYINKWVESKIKNVYLRIDDGLVQTCPELQKWIHINGSVD